MKIDLNQARKIDNLDFLAKQLVEGFITGLHKSPYHGFSVEFAEHRLYNTGESTRHIDWKVYAKTDRMYTKRYEEETNLRCNIVVDNSASMHYPADNKGKLTFSLLGAAVLAHLLQRQRDAVGITTFSDEIEITTPIKSTPSHLNKVLIQLQQLLTRENTPGKVSNVAKILHEIAEKNHRRSLIILFSDMLDNHDNLDEIFKGLQHLKHNKHEVIVFHVTDYATEIAFDFDNRPYQFIDLESGQKLKVQAGDVKEEYRKQVEQFFADLNLRCGQMKIDFIPCDISKGYEEILNAYLIKRSRMK